MRISKESKVIVIYYLFIFAYWAILYFQGTKEQGVNHYYQVAEGFIPFLGGIVGIYKARRWGLFKSKLGAALCYISLGIFSWGIGQMLWSVYYNLMQHTEVPYPSLADVGFVLAIPFWSIGIYYLSKATGAHFSLKHLRGKIILFVIPILATLASYYLLYVVARGGSISLDGDRLKLFFDFAYPIGDLLILTLSLLIYGLSFSYLGGKYKISILSIILGFIVMYIADFSFSYTTTNLTYFNGHWVDILFPTAMTLMAVGVNNFDIEK